MRKIKIQYCKPEVTIKWTFRRIVWNRITETIRKWYYYVIGYKAMYFQPKDRKVVYVPKSELRDI
jgi:hypothetical protein